MSKTIIIGGGPAGMVAAVAASRAGEEVHIFEKNDKLGKKLFITGKGRCNITNASDMKTVMDNVVSNPRFLYSAFGSFSNEDIVELLENAGCRTKVERGSRVFPVSDHSSDVIRALDRIIREEGIRVHTGREIRKLDIRDGVCRGIEGENADRVIIATGGKSYPVTGSTGDGYRMALYAGHKVVPAYPSLVPLVLKEDVSSMMGLSLKNVAVTVYDGKKQVYGDFGEMLFTHFGVSGPVIISASAYVTRLLKDRELRLTIDLKPALDENTLDGRLLRDFEKAKNKNLKNSLGDLLPSGLIAEVIRQSGLDPDRKVNEISREERGRLRGALKELTYTVTGTRGWNEAIITQGGVSTKEIDPKTMESKLVKNLFFAGEVIDLDALTGGFNLQIAWSTGWCAGGSVR